jgi:MerR family transcriptional regulator, repressor of the yfmOP operon
MTATAKPVPDADSSGRTMRIGEVAELTGTTPRTIRYYEEIGLLAGGVERELGKHRCYTEGDVERINEIVRLKDLLGLSLEQLSQLLEAESARADIRRELKETEDPSRRRELVTRSLGHIETQLRLVRGRITELGKLERELKGRQQLGKEKLVELDELLGSDS